MLAPQDEELGIGKSGLSRAKIKALKTGIIVRRQGLLKALCICECRVAELGRAFGDQLFKV